MSAANVAIPDSSRLTLAETMADSRVMATRQLRKILRRPMYVVYLFVQPVIFVLLFRYVFGGAINTGRVSYVNYLMPGIIVMTAIFGSLTTGLGLTENLRLCLLVDQRIRRRVGPQPRDRSVGRVHLGLPPRLRLLGVRSHRAHARGRADHR
jgi:hypothetical protein